MKSPLAFERFRNTFLSLFIFLCCFMPTFSLASDTLPESTGKEEDTMMNADIHEEPLRIAFTFDDGPNTAITPQILDILEENDIVATFFLIGSNISPETESVVERAYALGCEIENHSTTHSAMDQMDTEGIRQEIDACSEKIERITGQAPSFFRPPYIALSQTLFDTVPLTFICGSGCQDWLPEVTVEERVEAVLRQATDGQIILLHDSWGNVNTVEAVRILVPLLKERGATFLTCAQLFDACGVTPQPGHIYSNVFKD